MKKVFDFLKHVSKAIKKKEKKVILTKCENKVIKTCSIFRIRLEIPILSIFEKAPENGFYKRTQTGKLTPTACRQIINLNHANIIRFYNQKIQKVLNYYLFVDNKKSISVYLHRLKHSCALTLALKLKLRLRSKVFKKFGKTLKCPETATELYSPISFKREQMFSI